MLAGADHDLIARWVEVGRGGRGAAQRLVAASVAWSCDMLRAPRLCAATLRRMSSDVQLALLAGLLGVTATLAGVVVTAYLEGRRRQRTAVMDVQRSLWQMRRKISSEASMIQRVRDPRRDDAQWAWAKLADDEVFNRVGHEIDVNGHEVEIRIPDLPYRVRGYVRAAVEIIEERRELKSLRAAGDVVGTTLRELEAMAEQAWPKSLLLRRQNTRIPPQMHEYLDEVERIRVERSETLAHWERMVVLDENEHERE